MSKTDDNKASEKKQTEEAEQIKEVETVLKDEKPVCGIIMPISQIDNCSAEHWAQVKDILAEAINAAGYRPSLVSEGDDSGVIHKRIVQNVYDNEIVVCDVSGKNPNVMFELGMRLAFDKPTIIVIDDKTAYSFDTGQIEHVQYPRDLSYFSIMNFKERLRDKITATIKASQTDPNYTTFLKHFGKFEVAHVENMKVPYDEALLSQMNDMTSALARIDRRVSQIQDISEIRNRRDSEIASEELINYVIKAEIERYCAINGRNSLSSNDNEAISAIIRKLEDNSEVRNYFKSPSRLRNYIRMVIDDIM